MSVVPARLAPGAHVRVVAPSRSLAIIGEDTRRIADRHLHELGLTVSFGNHVEECDRRLSSSITSRVADLHAAFADDSVDGIFTAIGGFNSNQLLPHLDWDLIRDHPKVLCGYSDITALSLAILTRTALVGYSGPHYSTFGMEQHLGQTFDWFRSAVMGAGAVELRPATTWSDDAWYLDQSARNIEPNVGWWLLREGEAEGVLVGGNLSTIALLHGTPYLPDLRGALLFIEDDLEAQPHHFDRHLTALSQQPGFDSITALLIGRFQRASNTARADVEAMIAGLPIPTATPVVANVDFGHTDPLMTLPVGGHARLVADGTDPHLTLAAVR